MIATPEQEDALARAWAFQEQWADNGDEDAQCFLQLRARIERLELGAGIRDAVAEEVQRSFPVKPDSSLVGRVRNAIASEYDPKDFCWDEARAAIRVIAEALHNNVHLSASAWLMKQLEQEVER